MKKLWLILIIGILSITCSIFPDGNGNINLPFRNFESNGERIFLTGNNNQGEKINYSGGSGFGGRMMVNSQYSCKSCHSEDGRGGEHIMHMNIMDAPDIRFQALQGEISENGENLDNYEDGETDQHTESHNNYNLETFRLAVVSGMHPDGKILDRDMPRWQLNDNDLSDLFEYIKTLP